ncbi:probable inactive 2-oxoglutarate-dependent dioxygenase AOP2 [Neltuma alba]|uniref:probable inactive 2-oxoglutarate-dependent dioxygenase AOP2 n=1 Tax=Neltuma alba TaxID=207710 RepID=UPI0010A3FB1C|nr:probable inactive 2-oxoglutarate-dependent dioxygenase AOP2 [Prosopis alba]
MGSQTVSQIPIIDFSDKNLKPGTETWFSAGQVLRRVLESDGCFYAMSNKVSMELCNSVFVLMDELFDLPLETKKQKTSDKPFHGYYERHPKVPLYESIGIDEPSKKEAVQKFTNIMWPAGYDHFCETLSLYAKLLVEMDQTAKRILFDAYGLDKTHCDSFLESTNYMLRSFKYQLPKKTHSNLGLPAHTDTSYFTILHQNKVAGLQIKLKNGEWIDADPSPNMFLFLAADALKVWSNDRIKACEHQVIIQEEKERCSMGLFSFGSKMVETQEELVDEEHPIRYKPFDHYDYIRFHLTSKAECRIKAFCGIDY